MLKKLLLTGAAASGLLVATSAQAAFISIDEFTGPNQTMTTVAGTQSLMNNEATPGAGGGVSRGDIAGGWRDLTTTVIDDGGFGGDTEARIFMGSGTFSHDQDSGVISQTMLTWDGNDADNTDEFSLNGDNSFNALGNKPTGNINLDLSGLTDFVIGVETADAAIRWQLQIGDGTNDALVTLGPVPEINSFQELSVSFSAFAGIDFSSIDWIRLIANSPNDGVDDLDTTINYLRAVPEPVSVALFGLGLLGVTAVRRRRH